MNVIALWNVILLCGMIGVLVSGVLHTFRLAKYCVCPRYPDDVSFYKLCLFLVQVCNFWADIYLCYALFWMARTYWYNPHYLGLAIVVLFVLVGILITNFVFVYKWLIQWIYHYGNPYSARWLFQQYTNYWFYALLCLSGSVFHTLCVVNCNIFGVTRTNMGLSQWTLHRLSRNKYIVWLFYTYSLLMLLCQTCVCILVEGAYIVNILSTVFTVLSMILFCTNYYCCHDHNYIHIVHGLEIVHFQLNVECEDHHNDDESILMKTKEMRNKWKYCIRNKLQSVDINHNKMNLQIVCVMDSKNPNYQQFTVYGVLLDLDSYWIHLMQQCIDDDSMATMIQHDFELAAMPQVSLIGIEMDNDSPIHRQSASFSNLSQQFLISIDE